LRPVILDMKEDKPMFRLGLALLYVTLCVAPARGQTAEQKKETIAYLRSLQTQSGGFLPARPPRGEDGQPSLRATTGALRALKYFGGQPRDAKACAAFVKSCFDDKTGGFRDKPSAKTDIITTAVGIMAMMELKAPVYGDAINYLRGSDTKNFEEIRMAAAGLEAVEKRSLQRDPWLKQIAEMRNHDGSYGKGDGMARDTGSAVVTILRLGGQLDKRDKVLEVLRSGQRSDGGFGKADTKTSDLESTYRIMRAFHMMNTQPADVDALRRFIARCRNTDGAYGIAPDQPSTVGSTYFAAIILHWLDSK
jgi:prenyltransferase beta subunit